MAKDTKIIIGVIVATLAIIFGGMFLVNKGGGQSSSTANPTVLIRDNSYVDRAENESDVLVEFGDLQCPACGAYHPLIKQAREEFKDSMTYVFRNFPLTQHKNAKNAAYFLEAAGLQDKYWEVQNKLYETQNEWSELDNPTDKFMEYGKEFSLDEAKLKEDMSSDSVKKKVEDDLADGSLLNVNSTPTFYLNGEKITFQNYTQLKSLISK